MLSGVCLAPLLCVLQATEIHKEFAARRNILQQQLARLQQESRLSVNPLLLPGGTLALPAAGQQQQQQDETTADPQQQQPAQQNAAAAAAGQVPAASASLAVAGPHQVTPQGNIILLPDDSIQAKLDKLLAQIEEFTTPRCAAQHELQRGGWGTAACMIADDSLQRTDNSSTTCSTVLQLSVSYSMPAAADGLAKTVSCANMLGLQVQQHNARGVLQVPTHCAAQAAQ